MFCLSLGWPLFTGLTVYSKIITKVPLSTKQKTLCFHEVFLSYEQRLTTMNFSMRNYFICKGKIKFIIGTNI